jgi:GNAT superfamily N-acetyltransferase
VAAVAIRTAEPVDAHILADLHTRSWRSAYRGILSDAYLERAHEDRARLWRERMAHWNPARSFAAIAEADGEPIGFVCVMADAGPEHGVLLDNLHMRPDRKGAGTGGRLLAAAGKWVAANFPGTPMYLYVFAQNEPAIGFYRRRGGEASASIQYKTAEGNLRPAFRFVWARPGDIAG